VQEMEVWTSGAALQGEASHHRELRRSRAGVVSVAEKSRRRPEALEGDRLLEALAKRPGGIRVGALQLGG
jgi:hypothetical protein